MPEYLRRTVFAAGAVAGDLLIAKHPRRLPISVRRAGFPSRTQHLLGDRPISLLD